MMQYLQLDSITTHNWKLCGCSAYLNEGVFALENIGIVGVMIFNIVDVLQPAHWLLEDIAKRIFYYSPATQGVDDTPEVHNYSNGDVSRMRKKAAKEHQHEDDVARRQARALKRLLAADKSNP
eukprot:Filipodium_phascolosomae@DN2737_c1_g1_i16.p1